MGLKSSFVQGQGIGGELVSVLYIWESVGVAASGEGVLKRNLVLCRGERREPKPRGTTRKGSGWWRGKKRPTTEVILTYLMTQE